MLVSVVIPTYNRKDSLLRTLNSLAHQTYSTDLYEVIVVDDGSTDDTLDVARQIFPFVLHYIRQDNQGATLARNNAVMQSQGKILIFIDDDVTVSSNTLEILAETCLAKEKILTLGTLISKSTSEIGTGGAAIAKIISTDDSDVSDEYVHFTACNTELLAIKRTDFFELGMLQDPTNNRGWPNWDDVDFGYRAHLKGFQFLRSARAIGIHWDYSLTDYAVAALRWKRASKSAVCLFQTHPGIKPHIPMFRDKFPIDWKQDSSRLIVRKLARQLASSFLVVWGLEKTVIFLEKNHKTSFLLNHLYRWIYGAYMFQGFHEGLRKFGSVQRD